ncbi:MAG: hypothetical protein QM831_45390 [Kofleriaceae bacterium]
MALPRVWPIVLGLVGACITQSSSDPPYYGGGDDGGGGWSGGSDSGYPSGGTTYYGCQSDTTCSSEYGSGYVCARDGECALATDVRSIRVSWTLQSAPADSTSCAAQPTLALTFTEAATGDWTGFAPVPCSEGSFFVDKFPKRFGTVMLSPEWGVNGPNTTFNSDGTATLDLPY